LKSYPLICLLTDIPLKSKALVASIEVDTVCILRHAAVPDCGSFEVRCGDGSESKYFYWDNQPSRRTRPGQVDRETALEQARGLRPCRAGSLLKPNLEQRIDALGDDAATRIMVW